jgi:flavin-dependent dehydrogenase
MSKTNAHSSLSPSNRERCDVVVLGGGPAGAAAAITLARGGRSVVVLEKSEYDQPRIGETLSPAARSSLARLGVWDQFLGAGHAASPSIRSVWGEDAVVENHFIFNPYGNGWHLDRRAFDMMLAAAARNAGARLCCGVDVRSCEPAIAGPPLSRWRIEFADHHHVHQLHATFVIDATGRVAAVARRQGAHRIAADHLVGVVVILGTDRPTDTHEGGTLVEAAEDGWWYSAPLPGSRLIAAYMTDADLLPRQRRSWAEFWLARLQATVQTQGQLRSCGASLIHPPDVRVIAANSSRLDRTSGPGWLAVGDAALAFDPLSAQGLRRALSSGIRAGEAIHRSQGADAAALTEYDHKAQQTFREYERVRATFYRRERRWPDSAFWRRRHGAIAQDTSRPGPPLGPFQLAT